MIVDWAVYRNGERDTDGIALEDAYDACAAPDVFAWIGLHEPDEEEFDAIRREFQLHPLAIEDAVHAHQRPKLEVYDDSLFVVLKTVRYVDSQEIIELGEVCMFIGDGFIVTVRHGEAGHLHEVRLRLENEPELLACGPSAVLYAIADRIVDEYQPALDGLEQDIAQVEEQVFSDERENPAERIYKLKREAIEFHRAVSPLVEPLHRLARGDFGRLVHQDIQPYFRDVHDHTVRAVNHVETIRDLLTSVLEANLSQVSVRQNDDMRRISAWIAIVAVPTMLAGIYGMNFEHMPELKWTFGYPLVVAVMLTVCFGLYRYFRRAGWL